MEVDIQAPLRRLSKVGVFAVGGTKSFPFSEIFFPRRSWGVVLR